MCSPKKSSEEETDSRNLPNNPNVLYCHVAKIPLVQQRSCPPKYWQQWKSLEHFEHLFSMDYSHLPSSVSLSISFLKNQQMFGKYLNRSKEKFPRNIFIGEGFFKKTYAIKVPLKMTPYQLSCHYQHCKNCLSSHNLRLHSIKSCTLSVCFCGGCWSYFLAREYISNCCRKRIFFILS